MSYDTLQTLLIAIAVLASAIHAMRNLAPTALRTVRKRLAVVLLRPQRNASLRMVGRWLAQQRTPAAAACGGGCRGCEDAGPAAPR